MKGLVCAAIIVGFIFLSSFLYAAQIDWIDWQSYTEGKPGSATGKVGEITVSYQGEVYFAQTGSGIDYWTEWYPKPYTGNSVVDNPPTAAEMIALRSSGVENKVTFSKPVFSPVMAFVSIGRFYQGVTYNFNKPFTFLSEGYGYWGDGRYEIDGDSTKIYGNSLTGYEFHGVIQFQGWLESISWTVTNDESWHGFTFGLPPQPAQPVPEPGTILLLGPGLFFLIGLLRKK